MDSCGDGVSISDSVLRGPDVPAIPPDVGRLGAPAIGMKRPRRPIERVILNLANGRQYMVRVSKWKVFLRKLQKRCEQ
jgi:hypothetical protein